MREGFVVTLNSYKLTLVFIFSIVIPSTLLSFFALGAISKERQAYRARVRQRLQDGAEKVAADVDRRLAARADEALRAIATLEGTVDTVGELRDVVRALASSLLVLEEGGLAQKSEGAGLRGAGSAARLAGGEAGGAAIGTGPGSGGAGGTIIGSVFLVGPGGVLLHPDPGTGSALPQALDPGAQARLDAILSPAEALERTDPRAALGAYDLVARTHAGDPVVQVEVLDAKGRVYRRLRDDLNALLCYTDLVELHPLGRDREGRCLAPAARLELADIQRGFNNAPREVAELLLCVEAVERSEDALGTGAAAFYRRRALARLAEVAGSPGVDPKVEARVRATLEDARREREAARAFARKVKAAFLPRLAQVLETAMATAPAPGAGGGTQGAGTPARAGSRDGRLQASGLLVERTPEGRSAVIYTVVRRARERGAAPLGLIGFELDLETFRRLTLEPVVTGAAHDEGLYRIVERGAPASGAGATPPGAPPGPSPISQAGIPAGPGGLAAVAATAPGSPPPPAAAAGALEDEIGDELARVALRAPLDHLEIVGLARTTGASDPLGRVRDSIYYWAIGLSIVCLGAGAFVLTRTVWKEMAASELKSDFVTTVTHELKTPLTSIGMFAETLLMGRVQDPDEATECLQIIAKETDRLRTLIDRVLTFSKIEAGTKRYDLKLTDMGTLAEETVELFRQQMRSAPKPFKVEVTIVQGAPKVLADRESIREVLLNLLSNAYKYGRDEKRIQVTVTKRRSWVAVDVQDWGIGIPWREQRKIFRKFYRANDVLTREVEGSGIGLTLARSIARAHRGDITVRSKLDAGSTFTLWLPR